MRSRREEPLLNALLHLPEVGAVSGKGGAVALAQEGGEPLALMLPEVVKDRLVGVEPRELSDDLDGEDLRVRKFRQWTTRSEMSVFGSVVDEAEDGDDEGAKVHWKRPPSRFGRFECHRV